ncbi:MAG: hypothetical protein JKY31_13305 [Rhodobacteraceae bacterium]|nr:hypothetical protein [Paracoccaceae bacterium]
MAVTGKEKTTAPQEHESPTKKPKPRKNKTASQLVVNKKRATQDKNSVNLRDVNKQQEPSARPTLIIAASTNVAQPTALKELPDEKVTPDLTVRGTPRSRKPKRTRHAVGGDPNAETHRFDVKLGGRIPRDLRDDFVVSLAKHELVQGAVLTEIIEAYLDKLDCD